MDANSQQTALLLNALAAAVDQLQLFGYALYLDTKAPSWTQPRSVTVSGKDFQILQASHALRFERALILSFTLQCDTTATRWVVFSILFAWNTEYWFIQPTVEEEVSADEQTTRMLWESPAYQAGTIDTAIQYLHQALQALIDSKTDKHVAEALARIKHRQQL